MSIFSLNLPFASSSSAVFEKYPQTAADNEAIHRIEGGVGGEGVSAVMVVMVVVMVVMVVMVVVGKLWQSPYDYALNLYVCAGRK